MRDHFNNLDNQHVHDIEHDIVFDDFNVLHYLIHVNFNVYYLIHHNHANPKAGAATHHRLHSIHPAGRRKTKNTDLSHRTNADRLRNNRSQKNNLNPVYV